MSALTFARQAFGREKPHSSITDWVEILTSSNIDEEAYDGIPELVDAINLQASGPAEASRALRKKLKHGNSHQQYRSLVLLKALVENCGQKFQSQLFYDIPLSRAIALTRMAAGTFADGHMTDAIRLIANDPSTDRRVKKKLILVLGSWRDRYKDDPSMAVVAGLYSQCRVDSKQVANHQEIVNLMGLSQSAEEKKRREKQEAKLKAKKEKEERARKEEENRRKTKRVPFDFEKDKPKVLASIVEGSQASSNLVNAITLVNLATDSLETNERVQECLAKAKQARKPVVRYIQLVENEDVIGTLIETNDRIVAALEMYEKLLVAEPENASDSAAAITAGLAAANIGGRPPQDVRTSPTNEDNFAKGKDRSGQPSTYIHPDLEDLSFGPLGNVSGNLPPPLRPSALSDDGYEHENVDQRGSLSDFSDYESSDEETHKRAAGPSTKRRSYVTVSDDEDDPRTTYSSSQTRTKLPAEDDPFADPFADR
ncbi:hypothetical protein CPC08DRAFT_128322 [Agrocybe pediades]|nr:hypothetical protein CPC08DRAFT_128322 [Agrocybe pediades]